MPDRYIYRNIKNMGYGQIKYLHSVLYLAVCYKCYKHTWHTERLTVWSVAVQYIFCT